MRLHTMIALLLVAPCAGVLAAQNGLSDDSCCGRSIVRIWKRFVWVSSRSATELQHR